MSKSTIVFDLVSFKVIEMENLRLFCCLVLVLLVSAPSPARADSGGWTWGVAEGDTDGGSVRGTKIASVQERDGKGDPLILMTCWKKLVQFVDGPEQDFWVDESVGTASAHIGFMKFEVQERNILLPYVSEPGMDGEYFTLNLEGAAGELTDANDFSLCPTEKSSEKRCRTFSLARFREALQFVCD